MLRIDYSTLVNWCKDRGYDFHEWTPSLRSPRRKLVCRKLENVQHLPDLLDSVVNSDDTERLVWIRDWTIWNDRSQDIGLRAIDLLTDHLSEMERQIDSHIYVLSAPEWRETIALLAIPILFGWDAHLLFGSGSMMANISHHGEINLSIAVESVSLSERLSGWCDAL